MAIYSFFSWQFWWFFFLFLVSSYIVFYIPGAVFLSRKKLEIGLQIILSFCLGIALWGFQAYIFGYIHLRILSYGYLVIMLLFAWRRGIISIQIWKRSITWLKKNPLVLVLAILGITIQLIAVVGSGVMYADGVRFFGVNRADGIMHLAFIQSMTHFFPPIEPGSYGHPITNYHYWSDLILADLVRVWRLPISHTFFQYFPLLISSLTVIAAYQVVRVVGFSKRASLWSLFFFFFAGDVTYLLLLFFLKSVSFSTPALDNGAGQFLNMPNAVARLLFLAGIMIFHFWTNNKNDKTWGVTVGIIFSSLIGLKIYYGIFALFGIGLVTLVTIVKSIIQRKISLNRFIDEYGFFIGMSFVIYIIGLGIFLPANSQAGGLVWSPLEWPKLFLGTDVLNWGGWWMRYSTYLSSHNYPGIIIFAVIAIVIALLCVHGTRIIGFFPQPSIVKKLSWEMRVFLYPGLIVFHIVGLFFLQKSGGLNIFNFLVVGTVVLSLLSSFSLDYATFSVKKPLVTSGLLLIIILTVPRVIVDSYSVLTSPKTASFLVSKDELAVFNYIRENTPKSYIIQSHPANPQDYISPYVAFFSDRLSYLTGVKLQETHNQPLDERKAKLSEVFSSKSSVDFFGQARAAKINLIYLRKVDDELFTYSHDPNLVTTLFDNNSAIVYRVNIYR